MQHKDLDRTYELVVAITADGFDLDWQESEASLSLELMQIQNELQLKFKKNPDWFFFELQTVPRNLSLSESLQFLVQISDQFFEAATRTPDLEPSRASVRIGLDDGLIQQLLDSAPYLEGSEFLTSQWLQNIWNHLSSTFSTAVQSFSGSIEEFLAHHHINKHPVGRVFFHLVESKDEEYPFAFLATYSSESPETEKSRHFPLKNALQEYQGHQQKLIELLATVSKAAANSPFIAALIESGEIFHPLRLTSDEAYIFLREVPLYEEAGILCRIPKWWGKSSNAVRIAVSIGDKAPSHLGFDALIDFNVQLSIGNQTVTAEELQRLLDAAEGLALIKGKWVEVDHHKLQELLAMYEQTEKLSHSEISLIDAMRLPLSSSELVNVPDTVCEVEVTHGQWLKTVMAQLVHPQPVDLHPDLGTTFHAHLREYQKAGLAWLLMMKQMGLGACLADDMGLGKTVQVIALLHYLQQQTHEKTLLVIPASLIGNWLDEINKFAPSLRCAVLHPSFPNSFPIAEHVEQYDIVLTTYAMLSRYDWLMNVFWDILILDEAQAIRNPGTQQTRIAKRLRAAYKVAMTGTPIENRLSDLWSLFDFLNRGLLGTATEFTHVTKQLKQAPTGYAPLKRVVSPFILRRLKTDPAVISDLPDKIEMKTFATLTKKQAALYSNLVQEIRTKLESQIEGIQRKGLILASLLKFKQICNHPDQYLGQNGFDPQESGKFLRLGEICQTIHEKHEKVLVFTQFKEITAPLREFLETVFHHSGLTLHGDTPVSKRKELVTRFQGSEYVPFMVASIKAGGVGLNLTAANHVIHFDRWWNPAVENQATDRAFRIGQKKNVVVHKFVTQGTIEEKIDRMITEKIQLAADIVPDLQTAWLAELDNEELINLFRLTL
ncbi:MAG: DEAD/DEAH box helicase [Firmicutes bacterium]|nr:DEAD/DEAH box helicase [Bacillota bacterium]